MTYQEFLEGLEQRNFQGTDGGENSKGKCHTPDKKHYILSTDGMIIYSNIPYHDQSKYYSDSLVKEWFFDEFDFNFLDEIIYDKTTTNAILLISTLVSNARI